MGRLFVIIFALILSGYSYSQNNIFHVDPPNWWYGMENPYLELMIHGDDIAGLTPKVSNSNITIVATTPGDSPNYLFLGLDLTKLDQATNFTITLSKGLRKIKIPYSLQAKRPAALQSRGISSKDAIYLITPDRFVNGNPENDDFVDYQEVANRQVEYGRHGGDIEGIIASLDYIDNIGFNAVWLNPVLENDMASSSYHGYATTDYYKVDERFGGNASYANLRDELERKDMKLIMDMIANHCGSSHWWMDDLPMNDWINYQDEYLENKQQFNKISNHRKTTIIDPYVAPEDRKLMTDGWFVTAMPDLNQRNPQMATYIIQNSIWWVETMNLAAIRQDTYSYPDEFFLSDWACSLQSEFPNLFVVGEEWSANPVITSYWQQKSDKAMNHLRSESCLPSVMDFPMQMTVAKALKAEETWNTGLAEMYEMMANDVLYEAPMDLVIFPDNHDMDRVMSQMKEDVDLWKMAMIYYATMRGIPQVYYGTEILMSNGTNPSHDVIRTEFPGGWPDHEKNAFTKGNLTQVEIDAQEFTSKLYNWRKTEKSIHEGTLLHYIPMDGVYVYFRTLDDRQTMVVLNKNKDRITLDLSRFQSMLEDYASMTDVLSQNTIRINKSLVVPAKSGVIYTMSK